ncbi:MAG: nucleoside-diphosphate kinase [Deltaproteobacteria bacterium]|nr:MAG: nucleoside-diphosphate kinase [Deltaproteobacteria bacterium]
MKERTLCIVKPDAMRKRVAGRILAMIEERGLVPVVARILTLAPGDAERFYAVHRERKFFPDLVRFMSSGPVLVAVLEGDEAIARWRDLMGPTDATKAPKGTIRGEFGTDVEKNAVHGSDAPETARAEIGFFFASLELPGATAGV